MDYLTSENLCIYIYSTVHIQDSDRSLLLVSGKLSYVITDLLKLTLSIITLWTFHSILPFNHVKETRLSLSASNMDRKSYKSTLHDLSY